MVSDDSSELRVLWWCGILLRIWSDDVVPGRCRSSSSLPRGGGGACTVRRTARRTAWCTRRGGTVLYEGSDVRTSRNGFVLPRDRGLEYASLKYRRRNSVIIIASLLEYKRALLYHILPTLTVETKMFLVYSVTLLMLSYGYTTAKPLPGALK